LHHRHSFVGMQFENKAVLLTQRERHIIALIADGRSAKEIGRKMDLSPRTVERHIEDCRNKLRARNRAELITRAVSGGYLPASEN
jgi:DNA-binding NarL/FixJ family response regulator